MIAVAGCILDGKPAPRQLKNVWREEGIGAKYGGGWIDWPAKMVTEFSVVKNYNNVLSSYQGSTNKVEWTKRNPSAWDAVARYLSYKIHKDGD